MKFRPCIDLHGGKVKQIVGSTLTDSGSGLVTNFETDLSAAHFARIYSRDGFYGGHIIMLGPGNENAALAALGAFPGGLHCGGGITPENAGLFLDAGASHVIVTSYVFVDGLIRWDRLEKMSLSVGRSRLVLDLSCKLVDNAYVVHTDRWQKSTSLVLDAESMEQLASYCDEFLVHAAHVEGLCNGVDTGLVELLGLISPLPVTYAGGIRSLDDLETVLERGGGRVDVTIGSALDLFGGTLEYSKVVQWVGSRGLA